MAASAPSYDNTEPLFHGKNFGADYWENTLRALSAQGYRVIALDQIGFGKSSKPEIRYTFAMLADNTVRVLDHLKVGRVAIVANSMGGMWACTSRAATQTGSPRYAHVSALTYQMIYEGPTYHELPKLTVPVLLTIGQFDRTVFGRRFAPAESVKDLGYFPQLGKDAQKRVPGAKLVEFDNVGHVPHLEAPERFHAAVLEFLADKR